MRCVKEQTIQKEKGLLPFLTGAFFCFLFLVEFYKIWSLSERRFPTSRSLLPRIVLTVTIIVNI
jgi:hypothetical protein